MCELLDALDLNSDIRGCVTLTSANKNAAEWARAGKDLSPAGKWEHFWAPINRVAVLLEQSIGVVVREFVNSAFAIW